MRLIAGLAAVLLLSPIAAQAECKRLAFSVNDYGKVGPARDAQALLDKSAAKWAAARGASSHNVGKKTVTCKLFLDFVVFDEYTCTAEATVCTGRGKPRGPRRDVSDAPSAQRPVSALAPRPVDGAR